MHQELGCHEERGNSKATTSDPTVRCLAHKLTLSVCRYKPKCQAMELHRMDDTMEAFELRGHWWLIDDVANSFVGTLRFSSNEGITLEAIRQEMPLIDGSLLSVNLSLIPVIAGVVEGGKRITLQDCVVSTSRRSFPGPTLEVFQVRYAFVGVIAEDQSQLRFNRAVVSYSRLPDWVSFSGMETHLAYDEDRQVAGVDVAYRRPKRITVHLSDAEIAIGSGFAISGDQIREVTVKQMHNIDISINELHTLEEIHERFLRPLADFLTFATGTPNSLLQLYVYSPNLLTELPGRKAQVIPVEVYYHQIFQERDLTKLLTPDRILVPMSEFGKDLEEVIRRWLELSTELRDVFGLYFSVKYRRADLYSEQYFLAIIQTIETYHRLRRHNQVLSESEHAERMAMILEPLSANHALKDWLNQKLSYSNEPSLIDRLRELTSETKPVIDRLVPSTDKFMRKVTDTRNYLTHYDPRLRSRAARGQELYSLTRTLEYVLMTCLLIDLGLSLERCVQLFGDYSQYGWAIREAEGGSRS